MMRFSTICSVLFGKFEPWAVPRAGGVGVVLLLAAFLLPASSLSTARAQEAESQEAETEGEAPAAAPAEAPAAPAVEDEGEARESRKNARLRELQNRVVSLKEEIFRTKTRLMLIKERLLNNVIAEAKLVLVHQNELGGSFTIEEVTYYLDDNKIYFGDEASANLDEEEFAIYDGTVVPGHHVLLVDFKLRGESGFFSYLEDFRFRIRSNYTFFASRGRISVLVSQVYESGGFLTDFRDRPKVNYELQQLPYTRDNLEKVSGGEG